MVFHILAIGKLRGALADSFNDYAKRFTPKLVVLELVVPAPKESVALLAAVPKNAFVVALDPLGKEYDSPTFAKKLEQWQGQGKPLAFIIGGADGLSDAVKARADTLLSLGKLTWPHLLVRVMLAEQLYRARQIAAGHPYHRE